MEKSLENLSTTIKTKNDEKNNNINLYPLIYCGAPCTDGYAKLCIYPNLS